MENYGGTRFDTKIETFDPCIIEAASQRTEIGESTGRPGENDGQDLAEMRDNSDPRIGQEETQQQPTGQIATIQPNAMTNMTLTPVRLPALLDGEFFSVVRVEDTNVMVRCLQCDKLLNGNLKSTGNFLSHIKRVHPFMLDTIKCKSNQRRPAIAYIDMSAEKSAENTKSKRGHRKFCKPITEDNQMANSEEAIPEQAENWPDSPVVRRRKYDETTFSKSSESQKFQQPPMNTFVGEDEFDAIGKNVAAKLRNMRLDQRIVAEKLLNDVLFEAQLGTLHRDSSLHV